VAFELGDWEEDSFWPEESFVEGAFVASEFILYKALEPSVERPPSERMFWCEESLD
jgi:hypothetical protein